MLEALASEFSIENDLNPFILVIRILGTVLFCGIIGFEREYRKNTAGLRTNILVGVASATFALIALALLEAPFADSEFVKADPLRLVEAVTNGVAFLAAGIVVFSKGEVRGLTTGASLWVAAAIGLAVGLGYWTIAIMVTVTGFIVLAGLRQLEVAFGVKEP